MHRFVIPLRRSWRWIRKWCFYGKRFRRYAPQNPPAEPSDRLRIGVCSLIPLLGDSVLLFPIVDAIAREQPNAEIVGFVSGAGKNLSLHPALSRVYVQPRVPDVGWLWPVNVLLNQFRWWRRDLRDVRLHLCVMPRGGFDPFCSAFLSWMLGARERVGFTSEVEPERAETDMKPSPLLTREVNELNGIHELERGSDVLKLAGLITRPIDPREMSPGLMVVARGAEGRDFVSSFPELRGKYFVVSPGASLRRKQWPFERFIELIISICVEGCLPVLVGGNDTMGVCGKIAPAIRSGALNLAGRTSFAELSALCAGAEFFIGNDSGPAHIAGLCGVPTVVISHYPATSPKLHQTSPARIHPAGPRVRVVQPNRALGLCQDECLSDDVHCISQVTVQEARAALEDVLITQRG